MAAPKLFSLFLLFLKKYTHMQALVKTSLLDPSDLILWEGLHIVTWYSSRSSARYYELSSTWVSLKKLLNQIQNVMQWNAFTCLCSVTLFLSFFFFLSFRAAPSAYGGSQARGPVGTGTRVTASWNPSHTSVTYSTAHGNARSLTHWARPGIKPASSWILVRFTNCWAMTWTPMLSHFVKTSNRDRKWLTLLLQILSALRTVLLIAGDNAFCRMGQSVWVGVDVRGLSLQF